MTPSSFDTCHAQKRRQTFAMVRKAAMKPDLAPTNEHTARKFATDAVQ